MAERRLLRASSIFALLGMLALSQLPAATAQTVLLDFTSPHCGPCQQLKPTIERLRGEGYPVDEVDVVQQQALAQRFQVTRVPCLVMLVDGREQTRLQGAASYEQLRDLFTRLGVQPATQGKPVGRGQSPERSPAWTQEPATPRPSLDPHTPIASRGVEASASALPHYPVRPAAYTSPEDFQHALLRSSVRIKVEDSTGHSYGTGTIIDTLEGDALVITCGHLFRDEAASGTITIELFEPTPSGVRVIDRLPGRLESHDLTRDIGLVSFRPRTPVRIAKVASEPRENVNDPVWSVGCDRGADPTVRTSRVTAIDRYQGPANIEAAGAPVEGRSGGGLFNAKGELVGVCFAADNEGDEGLYAALPSIYAELDRMALGRIYQPSAEPTRQLVGDTRRTVPLPGADSQPIVRGQNPDTNGPTWNNSPESAVPAALTQQQFPAPPVASLPAATPPAAVPAIGQLVPAERAALQEIAQRASQAEVVCIVRSNEPGAASEVIQLERVSPEFLQALRAMSASSGGAR